MKKRRLTVLLAVVLIVMAIAAAPARSANSEETLKQYVSDLRKNPDDYSLREKIIELVQEMKPMPTVPPEVAKHEGAAEYAFKNAKTEADYLDSAKEYEKALLVAPWLAADYFNCGVAYEKAGRFKNAIAYFNLYLMAAPDAKDANAVRKRIGGLEYAAKKAAGESSPEAIAAKKQNEYEEWFRKLDGVRYEAENTPSLLGPSKDAIDIIGKEAVARSMLIRFDDEATRRLNPSIPVGAWRDVERSPIKDGQFVFSRRVHVGAGMSCTINKDGNKIVCSVSNGDGTYWSRAYYRGR